MFTATAAHLSTLTGTDAALLADDFDAEPIDRLTEDENPAFTGEWIVDHKTGNFDFFAPEDFGWLGSEWADEDYLWGRSIHNNG